ncbi:MAG: hypothetical protein GQ583_01755 [Methyloprofundus sp.]|nr:hypothetical protein [Methyloprofundus sp.]
MRWHDLWGRNRVQRKNEKPERLNYFLASLLYFTAWIIVVYFMFAEIKGSDGINSIFLSISDGNYYPALLVTASIVLLALFINKLTLYLKSNSNRAS